MYRMSCVLLTSVYHFCVCILRYKVYMICALHKSKDSIVQMFAELVLFIHYSRCKLSIHWLVKTLEFYQSWLNVFRLLLLFCKSKCKIVNKKIVCAFTQAHTHTHLLGWSVENFKIKTKSAREKCSAFALSIYMPCNYSVSVHNKNNNTTSERQNKTKDTKMKFESDFSWNFLFAFGIYLFKIVHKCIQHT